MCPTVSYCVYMSGETKYLPIAMPAEIKTEVQRIAKLERRSMSQQAGELLEMGLAEYERQHGKQEPESGSDTREQNGHDEQANS